MPELAKLLSDEQLVLVVADRAGSDSRSGGRRGAWSKPRKRCKGKLLVGTINSIGVRRSAQARRSVGRAAEG